MCVHVCACVYMCLHIMNIVVLTALYSWKILMAPMFEVFALSLNYFVTSQEGGMVSILIISQLTKCQ